MVVEKSLTWRSYVTTASPLPPSRSVCLVVSTPTWFTLYISLLFFYMQKKEHGELWFADILFLKRALIPNS